MSIEIIWLYAPQIGTSAMNKKYNWQGKGNQKVKKENTV